MSKLVSAVFSPFFLLRILPILLSFSKTDRDIKSKSIKGEV
jgi:hypothetical protein